MRVSTGNRDGDAISSKRCNGGACRGMQLLFDVKCGDWPIVIGEDHSVFQVRGLPTEWPSVIRSTEAIAASIDDPADSSARDTFPRVDGGQRSPCCGRERTRKRVATALRKRRSD